MGGSTLGEAFEREPMAQIARRGNPNGENANIFGIGAAMLSALGEFARASNAPLVKLPGHTVPRDETKVLPSSQPEWSGYEFCT